MPGRRFAEVLLHQRGIWVGATPLLDAACRVCFIKSRCTLAKQRRITRSQQKHVLEAFQRGSTKTQRPCAGGASPSNTPSVRSKRAWGNALPDEDAAACSRRDGAARPRLQSHPRHEHRGQ